MPAYKRTLLGDHALSHRQLGLSARARQLLLLLESDALQQLSPEAHSKIANRENYQLLLDLALIEEHSAVPSHHVGDTPRQQASSAATTPSAQPPATAVHAPDVAAASSLQPQLIAASSLAWDDNILSLAEIKLLMQDSLKQYSGLMSKQLIQAIDQSSSTQDLRHYQSKWLTTMFETRMPRQQINALLQQINHSIKQLDSGTA
jgi:hypothetical protein